MYLYKNEPFTIIFIVNIKYKHTNKLKMELIPFPILQF